MEEGGMGNDKMLSLLTHDDNDAKKEKEQEG